MSDALIDPTQIKYSFGERHVRFTSNGDHSVTYPKGTGAPSAGKDGGFGGYYPFIKPPTYTTVSFSYEVYFPSDFEWNKGGKCHGLYFGSGASGGDHPKQGGSIRVMWRRNGAIDWYFYYPEMEDDYGESNIPGDKFKKGEWNRICISYTPETQQIWTRANGLSLMSFKRDFKAPCSGVFFSTFFGGSDLSWAAKKEEKIDFRNCIIQYR
jgi:hypothetical protein